mgnify:CR=1 FL=1
MHIVAMEAGTEWIKIQDASDVPNGIFDSSLYDFGGISDDPSPEPVALIRGDSLYTLVEGPTWEEAEANANLLGGHLATINDENENRWIATEFSKEKYYYDLPKLAKYILSETRIFNIKDTKKNTFIDANYFSYRESRKKKLSDYGRNISMVALN